MNIKLVMAIILLYCFSYPTQAQDTVKPVRVRPTQAERKPTTLATLLRGPYLQTITSNSIIIRWRTNALTRGVVNFGVSSQNLNQTAEDSTLAMDHVVQLINLQPTTKYYYSVGGGLGDTLQKGDENYFVTLPLAGTEGNYRIGVFGDCGNGSANQLAVRDAVLNYLGNEKHMNAWILLGDNAYSSGTDPEFGEKFFNVYQNNLLRKFPLYPSPGNHDYNDFYRFKTTAQATHDIAYYNIFSLPTKGEAGGVPSGTEAFYSFDIGNIHFLSLDSYGKEDGFTRMSDTSGAQVQWVKKDLAAIKEKDKTWVVAYWHHPPYTMGSHNSDTEMELVKIRENFIRILERNGVDLVLCGHSHLYERSKLMSGHYGAEGTFDSSVHYLNASTALYDGSSNSCPYIKNDPNQGTVYVVSGSAGASGRSQATYPHNAMYYSNYSIGGASMLEVSGNRLTLKWICADGRIRDHFVMMKSVNKKTTYDIKRGQKLALTASFTGNYRWSNGNTNLRTIEVAPTSNTTYSVSDDKGCLQDSFEVRVRK